MTILIFIVVFIYVFAKRLYRKENVLQNVSGKSTKSLIVFKIYDRIKYIIFYKHTKTLNQKGRSSNESNRKT